MLTLEKNARIVFAGDSITDAGRDRTAEPGGWGFGTGYVNQIHCLLSAIYPDYELVTINSGVSGDDIVMMAERWQRDVLDLEPDYVSVLIGVNDVWRHFDQPFWKPKRHGIDVYEQVYEDLIERTLPHAKGMIIVGPFMYEANQQEPMRAMVSRFAECARRLAERHGLPYVDVQSAIDRYLTRQHTCIVSQDRVHPYERGAVLITREWLRAVGVDWEREAIDD